MQPLSNERPDVRSPIVNFRNGIDPKNNKIEYSKYLFLKCIQIYKNIYILSCKQKVPKLFFLPESSNRALEPAGSPVPFSM